MSRTEKLYLGRTNSDAEPAEGKRTFVYDPGDPRGPAMVQKRSDHHCRGRQPAASRSRTYRPDVVSFVSAPLEKALPICGQIKVHLNVSTDVDDTAFTAKLMEVVPGWQGL